MAARPIDAAEGYRLYFRTNGGVELDEINEHLRGLGLREVSPRMYEHYRRLMRHGYESYIPINRFDIAVAAEHAWSEDLRARYSEIRQAVPAEITWGFRTHAAEVESLGAATATVLTTPAPPAATYVVLRLLATGISRTGTVVRSDPRTGRFHLAFDPYTSVPVASADAPYHATWRFPLRESAQSVVTVTDILLRMDRLLNRLSIDADRTELVRLSRVSLSSPLEIILIGGVIVKVAIDLAKKVAEIRNEWYQGTKAKYEAEGIQLDNDEKRRAAQLEADRELSIALDQELTEPEETPLLDQVSGLPNVVKGEPGSDERHKLIEMFKAAIDLPDDFEGESTGEAG